MPRAGPGAPLPSIPSQNTTSPIRSAPSVPKNQQRFSRESMKFRQQSRQQTVIQPNIHELRQQMEKTTDFKQRRISREQSQEADMSFLTQRTGGQARNVRETFMESPVPAPRPVPGGGRPKPRLNNNPRGKALWSYQKNDEDEISLEAGEIIVILKEDSTGWWLGKKSNGEIGLFPGLYVEHKRVNFYARVIYSYQKDDEDEISFEAGEIIEVLQENPAGCSGWWRGKKSNGEIGLFPRGYVEHFL